MRVALVLPLLLQGAAGFSGFSSFNPVSRLICGKQVGALGLKNAHRTLRTNAAAQGAAGLSAKTIAVFGSTGGVGLEAIYQSLGKGYKVKALARTPKNVVVPPGSGGEAKAGKVLSSSALTIIEGDVTRYDDVVKVMEGGVDGVIVALGGKTTEVGKTMLTDGTLNIIKAMKEVGNTNKVSIVTSIGTGESYDQAPLLFKVIMWTLLKDAFVDKNAQESLFLDPGAAGSDLEYVIVRPGGLTKGAPTGQATVLKSTQQAGSITRADVAAFCLSAIEDDAYARSAVCIS